MALPAVAATSQITSPPSPPAIKVIRTTSGFSALPINGFIGQIKLDGNGRILTVGGWIAPSKDWPARSIDEIVVGVDIPIVGADLEQVFRPDVVQARAADSLYSGFTIRLRLLTPLQALPAGASLCVAGSSEGKLVARARDHKEMRCR